MENLIKGFREETNQSLKGVQRRGEEVWKKLEEIEKKQKANENERKYEVEKLEERMKKLESKEEVTRKGVGGESGGEKVKVVDENVSIENER